MDVLYTSTRLLDRSQYIDLLLDLFFANFIYLHIAFADCGFLKPDTHRQPLVTDIAIPYETFSCDCL
jgi:hypothetical protein